MLVVFRSRLSDKEEVGTEYAPLAKRMIELAEAMPGFISYKNFEASDGERVSVIEFDSQENLRAWQEHPEHKVAQQKGRDLFYDQFKVQVCTVEREYNFKREK